MNHSWSHDTHLELEGGGRAYSAVFPLDHCTIAVLCDGIGSPAVGGRAASLAMKVIYTSIEDAQPDDATASNAIVTALGAAHSTVREASAREPGLEDMTCSVVIVALTERAAYVAHVGDARAYLLDGTSAQAVTRDHSIVNVYIDAGLLTPEDALTHPEAHVLARQLGGGEEIEVEYSEPIAIDSKTEILLCNNVVHANLKAEDWLLGMDAEPHDASAKLLARCREAAPDDLFPSVALLRNRLAKKPCLSSPPPEPYRAGSALEYEPTPVTGEDNDPASIFLAEALALEEDAVDMTSVVMPLEELTKSAGLEPSEKAAAKTENISPDPEPETAEVEPDPSPAVVAANKQTIKPGLFDRKALLGQSSPQPVRPVVAGQPAQVKQTQPSSQRVQFAAAFLGLTLVGAFLAITSLPSPEDGAFQAAELADAELTISVPESAMPSNLLPQAPVDPIFEEEQAMLFAPMLPPDPRRIPRRPQIFTQPPPGGFTQWNAVQAARGRDCPTSLDVVQSGMQVSLDNAQLYRQAWYCFNETHQAPLAQAEVATWRDFTFLVHHFEGTPEQRSERATEDKRVGPQWYQPAVGGIEYRLEAWATSLTTDRMAQVVDDLMGPAVVTDHLAKDILLEAQAAAGLSRSETLSEEAIEWWARRVYVAVRAMHGRAGSLIDTHRPELAPQIRALLAEATTPREVRATIEGQGPDEVSEEELWDPSGLPRAVALAHAAALGADLPELSTVYSIEPSEAVAQPVAVAPPKRPAPTRVATPPAPAIESADEVPTPKVYRFDSPMIQSER